MRSGMKGAICATVLMASPAAAQGPADKAFTVIAGQEVQIGVFANVNDACSGLPAPEVQVVAAPGRGSLVVKLVGVRVPANAKACADKQIPALAVFYRTKAGTEGADRAQIEATAGKAGQAQGYAITVTKAP